MALYGKGNQKVNLNATPGRSNHAYGELGGISASNVFKTYEVPQHEDISIEVQSTHARRFSMEP